jgi:gas vesicle protein
MTTVNKLMIGIVSGAILGVLFAPHKGSVTRRKLSCTGNNLRDKLKDIKNGISDKIDRLNEDLDDYAYQEMEIAENETPAKPNSWQ